MPYGFGLNWEYPIGVEVYLKKSDQIKTIDSKGMVSATFFEPYDKNVEPYIRVATGDYEELVQERTIKNNPPLSCGLGGLSHLLADSLWRNRLLLDRTCNSMSGLFYLFD